MAVKPIPEGFHTVTPYLTVDGVDKVLDFLEKAFDAKVGERMPGPDGRTMHAEVKIGDSHVMLGQAREAKDAREGMLYLYVEDADALYHKAVAAGGVSVMEPTTQFYGDRSGAVKDPAGNQWWVATHVEDISPEEMQRRAMTRSAAASS